MRYIIASAPLRTDSGPRRPRSSPNTLRTRFAVSDRSRGERALRPRRRLPSDIIASAPLRTDWGARRPLSSPNTLRTRFAVSEPFPRREVASTAPEHVEVHHRVRAPSDGLGATKATVIPEHASHAVRRLRPFPRRKGTSSAPEAAERHHRVRAPSDGLGGTKAAVIPEHPSHAVRRLRAVPAAGGGFDRAGAR